MASSYRNRSTKKPSIPKKGSRASSAATTTTSSPSIGDKTEGYDREFKHPSGRYWEAMVKNVISHYNGICHLCQHPGALQADHLIPYAETRDDAIGNLRPAHGTAGKQKNPCPVCGLNCNNIRGNLSVEAGRAKVQRRMAAQGTPVTPEPKTPDSGRDW